jgi:hypothetical protein
MNSAVSMSLVPRYETGGPDCELWRICTRYLESMPVWRYTRRQGHPPLMRYKDGGERGRWINPDGA